MKSPQRENAAGYAKQNQPSVLQTIALMATYGFLTKSKTYLPDTLFCRLDFPTY